MKDIVAIIDCGSQTTKLIAKRLRELKVYFKIFGPKVSCENLLSNNIKAIIISGGPDSILDVNYLRIDKNIFDINIPILGICYGMQLIINNFGGILEKSNHKEFGERNININNTNPLFNNINNNITVWMSHGDQAKTAPENFFSIASSDSSQFAAIACKNKPIFGVQFHPEVHHTKDGVNILRNFIYNIAKIKPEFNLSCELENIINNIKNTVQDKALIMALSGGVDSTVAAVIIHKAIGDKLKAVFVDHGLNREGEVEEVKESLKSLNIKLNIINAKEIFLSALKDVIDPEQKRKIIGAKFIEIFEQEALKDKNIKFLGQGTLYPDVIESLAVASGKTTIKSHHNVGGLPKNMKLALVEPLREFFKDEARELGLKLNINKNIINRQPFPGPGLAIRIAGEVTKERLNILRKADLIIREEFAIFSDSLWQYFAVLLPVRSVGVMGDGRTYGETIVIRAVTSIDAMTADWAKIPHESLNKASQRITNEVSGINRVLYDITQKPPSTIEWE